MAKLETVLMDEQTSEYANTTILYQIYTSDILYYVYSLALSLSRFSVFIISIIVLFNFFFCLSLYLSIMSLVLPTSSA
jgi:hypothetical protein